jgi:ATP-dependent DNA helicase PIF1
VGILIKRIINTPNYVNDWLRVKVLIVDEISMIEGHFLDKLDEIARTVRRNQKVFGGIQVIIIINFFCMVIHPYNI